MAAARSTSALRFVPLVRLLAALASFLFLALAGGGASAREMFSALDSVPVAALPAEARQTLELIKRGGPYPYRRDGVVFGNYEKRLPAKPRGYYHEFTVPTPGARDRGARRIVAGGNPQTSGEHYYTDDHYASFRRIRE